MLAPVLLMLVNDSKAIHFLKLAHSLTVIEAILIFRYH